MQAKSKAEHNPLKYEVINRAALTILGPLNSLVPWAPPMYEEIRSERRYLQIIVKEDVINQLCHPHANPSTVLLAKDYMMLYFHNVK